MSEVPYSTRCNQLRERFEQPHEVRKRNLALHRTLSGRALAEEINASNPKLVLDLGCGSNEFKRVCPNVIGVDLAGLPEVDLNYDIITLQKKRVFKRETADWILCFGPLNYGGTVWIQKIGNAIRYLLKPTGTCVIHVHPENSEVEWTDDVINYWGKRFGFKPTKMEIGHTDTSTMTEEELEIQHEVAQRSPDIALELSQGKTLVRPMIVWRWQPND